MADAAVGFVVQKLGDLILQEGINLLGVSDQVESLKQELQRMQCFLKDADAKKRKGDDERVKNWVSEMRDLAFEAEDIIDTFMYFKLRRQQKQSGCILFIKRIMFVLDEMIHRHNIHADIKRIEAKIQKLSESRTTYGIANIGETNGTTSQSRNQDVIPILPQLNDEIDIVGFDDEKKNIAQELVDISNTNRSVVSIVGMGGLGKTTLAKSIYNAPQVKRRFYIFAWIIISQEYTILEILKRISSEVSATPSGDTIRDYSIAISEKLKENKYLVVLDDIWEENVWNQLQKVFPDVNNGSRVIMTTRFLNIAKAADPTAKPHALRFLNEHESWELFLRKVFPRQDIETCCPIFLVDYAHQLVERCGGLPLALVVLGGLVSTKPQTSDAWQKVVGSMKGQFVEGGERCLEILALSYNDLSYHLKSCFLYFGCFREDMNIRAQTLIRLWSAEGFLPTKNDKTTEAIGFDCLEELAQRCLIQVTDRQYDGTVRYFRVHDLLRDMCIKEAEENRCIEIYKNGTRDDVIMSNAARRLIIFNEIETLNYSNSKLRGFFYNVEIFTDLKFEPLNLQLCGFKLLRVLCLTWSNLSKFPSEIKSLIHLRYLQLCAEFTELPSWIGHLRSLQTFIVNGVGVECLPDSLWTIDRLRHVIVSMSSSADPPKMGNNIVLKNLQTLKGLIAGEWIGTMLPNLTNLVKLSIHDVSDDDDDADALSSSLQKLGRLAILSIYGDKIPSHNIITSFSHQHHLKKLCLYGKLIYNHLPHSDIFPQQLVKLVLAHSGLEQDPMPTLEKLQFLKYLELRIRSYIGKQIICSATGFPQLLKLHISGCFELEEWKIEEKAMPCLKSLELSSCPQLKVIPEGLKNVPLDELELYDMAEELITRIEENTGEDRYKIQHVLNISISKGLLPE